MALFIAENTKYIILILFLIYIAGSLFLKFYQNFLQKTLIYIIHFFSFLCLFVQRPDLQILGFYMLQLLFLAGMMLCFGWVYKAYAAGLANHICMFFVCSMIILTRLNLGDAFRQFLFWIVGVGAVLCIPLLWKYASVLRKYPVISAVFGILLLGLVVVIGATSYGAKLHLTIGPISFQPSEFVKLVFILFIAAMLYENHSWRRILITSIVSAVFVLLLVAARDLGGALIYFVTYLMMLFAATQKKWILAAGTVVMGMASVAGYFLFSHVQTRVFAWLTPLADFDNKGYQISQSLFGISTGGWFGMGLGMGKPSQIPVVEKDFIFSALVEELGVVFGIGMIILVCCTMFLMISLARKCGKSFYGLICLGLSSVYGIQMILTIGGAIKFIPSTGVTLPLVSYGGSSLLATLLMFGVLLTIAGKQGCETKGQHSYQIVGGIFGTIFAAMIVFLIYFMIFESPIYLYSEYNNLLR